MLFSSSIVSPKWLADQLDTDASAVQLVDCRWYIDERSGRDAYQSGHIAGAVFADLDVDLSARPSASGGRHPLPHPEDFAEAMSRLGIGNDTPVVAYDDTGGAIAARLWWMLRAQGSVAAVLDGGMQSWGRPLTTAQPSPRRASFNARNWPPDALATADQVAARPPSATLLDARSADRYRGLENTIDPRFGHIPGARSAPWGENLGADGRLLPAADLERRFGGDSSSISDDTIVYCGSGVTACHNLLALDQIGRTARLYVGSWSEWGADPNRPIETDETQ